MRLRLDPDDANYEKTVASLILSLNKRRAIQAIPSLNQGEKEAEYVLNASRLVDRVFPMGNAVRNQNYLRGSYGNLRPEELAGALCIADVDQLISFLTDDETWRPLMERKPAYQALVEEGGEIDLTDPNATEQYRVIQDRMEAEIRTLTKEALENAGYLTRERYYPVSQEI